MDRLRMIERSLERDLIPWANDEMQDVVERDTLSGPWGEEYHDAIWNLEVVLENALSVVKKAKEAREFV